MADASRGSARNLQLQFSDVGLEVETERVAAEQEPWLEQGVQHEWK